MATAFWIEVIMDDKTFLYSCQMLGMQFHVSGKNKSILLSHDGQLLAGEIQHDYVKPIFDAIQRQLRPPGSGILVSIQAPT